MRILNVRDAAKNYSKFALPGFRSGSILKRIIACIYYFFVLVFTINSISSTVSGNFGSPMDVVLAIIVELLIVLIMLAPIIAIGFSDHYDWHGVKLFLIIMISWCILFTCAQFASTLFSDEFINSINTIDEKEMSVVSSAENDSSGLELDKGVIIDNIE